MLTTARYEFILRRLATILAVAILTLSLVAAISGILLAFYYQPSAVGAHESLKYLSTEVDSGWLVRGVHNAAGNSVIVVALIEIVVMFLGRQFSRSWLTAWISGILFTLSAIGLGWTAMILDWTQTGYWRLKVELGSIEAIPVIGSQLRDILTGGSGLNTTTVEHMYTLHSYVLAVGAVVLAVIHLGGVLVQEIELKQGVRFRLEKLVAPFVASSTEQETDSNAQTLTTSGSQK
ncbi:cytochrome b N-terminal domain-containing protein [Lyngbya aestuarii]|uniref:cytochrome b N-terminal domain-containing protein n=1 Tax=Lyngbya aestuarii TaxID=118322 RepID=UPI00403DA590